MKVIGTSKVKITIDEEVYSDALKKLSVKELNKLLRQKQSNMKKKKKVFVEMREIFQKQIDIIEEFINKI